MSREDFDRAHRHFAERDYRILEATFSETDFGNWVVALAGTFRHRRLIWDGKEATFHVQVATPRRRWRDLWTGSPRDGVTFEEALRRLEAT